MSTNTPSLLTDPEDAAIAHGARTSILTMAWAGLVVYLAILVLWLVFVPLSLWAFAKNSQPIEAIEIFSAACLFAIFAYALYGGWIFRKLLLCGRMLTPDGKNLKEALSLHRQFWTHAPFLSGLSLVIVLGILVLVGGLSHVPKS